MNKAATGSATMRRPFGLNALKTSIALHRIFMPGLPGFEMSVGCEHLPLNSTFVLMVATASSFSDKHAGGILSLQPEAILGERHFSPGCRYLARKAYEY